VFEYFNISTFELHKFLPRTAQFLGDRLQNGSPYAI